MKTQSKIFLQLSLWIFPWFIRCWLLNKCFGWNVSKTARIGFSIILVERVTMGANCKIRNLNFIKGLQEIKMGDYSTIGNLNWISGFPTGDSKHFQQCIDRNPCLLIGKHSAITNRHLIDCTDKVEIGNYTTFAGFRSQILTHSVDIYSSRQSCKPVYIGDYCFVGTSVVILGGSKLSSYSVLGAGAVLNAEFSEQYVLCGGVPAKVVKNIDKEAKYFSRDTGFIV